MKINTVLHAYAFNLKGEAEAYDAFCDDRRSDGLKPFVTCGGDRPHYLPQLAGPIELDCDNLFDNQWNSDKGRVFDWAEDYLPHGNQNIKKGHWLEQVPAMREIRASTLKCGYCGAYFDHGEFCDKCLGSEYLKPVDLRLLRLLPVASSFLGRRAPLSEEESAVLIPLYEQAQGLGKARRDAEKLSIKRKRIASLVPEAEKKAIELVEDAKTEAAALTWLMDAGYGGIDNVIFYSHSKRFGFGWRNPLTKDEHRALLAVLGSEFPFDYDIKTAKAA